MSISKLADNESIYVENGGKGNTGANSYGNRNPSTGKNDIFTIQH